MPAPHHSDLDAKVNIRISKATEDEAKEYAKLLGMSLSDLYRFALMSGLRGLQRSLFPERFIPKEAWQAMLENTGLSTGQLQLSDEVKSKMAVAIGQSLVQAMVQSGQAIDQDVVNDMLAGKLPENDTTSQ